jgi:uncharacterized glyoxalase superfamily protein PhnB
MPIYPTLSYDDAPAAIEFLCRAFGFAEHQLHRGPDGSVAHGELRLGDGIVMVGERRDDDLATGGTQLVYVVLEPEAIDAHHEQAAAAGAQVIRAPFDTDYGSRDYQAKDPEGNVWAFGTYRPEAPPTA